MSAERVIFVFLISYRVRRPNQQEMMSIFHQFHGLKKVTYWPLVIPKEQLGFGKFKLHIGHNVRVISYSRQHGPLPLTPIAPIILLIYKFFLGM